MANIRSIGPGRHHTSIAGWLTYLQGLSPLSDDQIGEHYGYTDGEETGGAITFASINKNGYTITLRAAAGQGLADHLTASDPLRYTTAKGAAFRNTSGAAHCIDDEVGIILEGMQIRKGTNYGTVFLSSASGVQTTMRGCIFDGQTQAHGLQCTTTGASMQIENCLIITNSSVRHGIGLRPGSYVNNCTVINFNTGGSTFGIYGSYADSGETPIKNNVICGFAVGVQNDNSFDTSDYNATSHATLPYGSNNITSITPASEFESYVYASQDFRLKSTSNLLGAGVAIGGLTEDIRGETRASPPCIGAWEFPGSSGSPYSILIDQGSYSVTGQTVALIKELLIPLTNGVYSVTGYSTELTRTLQIVLSQGSYSLTGNDAGLQRNLLLVAEDGSYTLSGQDVTLFVTSPNNLQVDPGAYVINGFDVELRGPIRISIESGVYIVDGKNVDLVYDDGTVPEIIEELPPFDPLAYLPSNLLPTPSRIQLLIDFYEDNGRAPTENEVISLIGQPISYGVKTDPLPDGFADRGWNNPNWVKELIRRS